jgi:hypothetical protein
MKPLIRASFLLAMLIAMLAGARPAMAYDGWLHGTLLFYQNQGNYCPTNRTCVGAYYLQGQFHQNIPLQDSRIYMFDAATDEVIGGSTTDNAGVFYLYWSSTAKVENAYFRWYGEHSGLAFKLLTPAGSQVRRKTSSFVPDWTSTILRQQTFTEPFVIGKSTNPDPYANVYDGAFRTWENSFSHSSLLQANFFNIPITTFENCSSGSSCAGDNYVKLGTGATVPYAYSENIAHELGHVASDQISVGQSANTCGKYDYDDNPGWNMGEEEYGCAGYEEAFATMMGDSARYLESARASADLCTGWNMGVCTTLAETNLKVNGTCPAGESRKPRAAYKFLWDVYDSGAGDDDTVSGQISWFMEPHLTFPVGTANHQRDEPFTSPRDYDGKSARDYRYWYEQIMNVSMSTMYSNNCSPVGD